MKEFETKVTDINKDDIINKLEALGATKTQDVLQKRWVFDPTVRDNKPKIIWWLRLRQEGSKITLTKKSKTFDNAGVSLHTEEVETEVSDFDATASILKSIKWEEMFYQENYRIEYIYKNISFSLDTWPQIPTYLEIESTSEVLVAKGLELLNLTGKDKGDLDVTSIYKEHGMRMHDFKELKF
jgi:adenylate cyclase, class 2